VRVVTVIGNRPQFVKAAAVSGPLRAEHEELLVHTGQHYDDELSTIFVQELAVPAPEIELGLGGGTNTEQTARMLAALGDLLREQAPDAVLVYGDTNSTLAGALAAAQAQIPVAHVEAGMRSFDRAMAEELNRVLTDHVADLLLVSSELAAANLAREGVAGEVDVVGDVMVDVARLLAPRARADAAPLRDAGVTAGEYVLATAHRAGTVDDPIRDACSGSWSSCCASSSPSSCRCTRARARGCRRRACWTASRPGRSCARRSATSRSPRCSRARAPC
jgi:UDP-N-acetylglucosamine 2-epimerase (non-hydrolysing)/UDP-GlcNAc3NAcA epimerase